ncbi:uncharacterized protein LOC127588835 [Hippocampus zosterae]|uniref:uncharacterized protein LOC127588835 n=1 Tax=Hippocampus zosterae TaxID=109293 RepID=UPI00223D2493|nr:uncharacterized protein LOC127588835 [Hippocampus zosterae]
MSSFGLELAGVSVALLGWALSAVSCALPMWRVSAFVGANIVTAQVYWEGLWMSCVFQSTGQMQCKVYDSMLALPADLQAARALTVVAVAVGALALLIALVGAKCTNCVEDPGVKARVSVASGAAFIAAALAELVPVSWSANTIVVEFYSPVVLSGQKMEIGAALYLGWAAALLLLVGGAILCCNCPPRQENYVARLPLSRAAYSAAPAGSVARGSYGRKDYVCAFGPPLVRVRKERRGEAAAMSMGTELMGICLGALGFVLSALACALPMWKVTAFVGANIITAQSVWEGLWMSCVTQSTGQMQCKLYDSMLALPRDLQAARALTVVGVVVGALGLLISLVGAKCTNCVEEPGDKARTTITAGAALALAGLLVLVPVCWTAHVVVRDFYNPILTNPQRRELGASLYVGWGAAGLLLIAGAILCSACPPKERRYKPPGTAYSAPRADAAGYERKDYV